MSYIKLGDASKIFVGSQQATKVFAGSTQVWPLNITYEIVASSVTLHYSTGSTIFASGSNYAYATGTVITKRGGTEISRQQNVTLTPKTFGGTNPGKFYIPAGSPNTIKGSNLHTTETSGYSATVTFVYLTSAETSAKTITQQANTPSSWSTWAYYSFTSYSISAPQTVSASAESFTVSGTLIYTSRRSRTWTSGDPEYDYAYNQSTSDNPTITNVQSSASARFEGNVVYISPNTGQSIITYNITASYTDPGGVTHTGYTATTTQSYVSYTYGDLSITEFTYAQIPASGNTGSPIYPKVSVSIPVYQGQTLVGYMTGTKAASSAANTMTVSGVGVSETVNLTFKVDGLTSTYGGVTASSLGTTPEASPTEVAGSQVTATLSGTTNKDTEYVVVYQQENVLGPEEDPADTTTSWYITIKDSQGNEVTSLPKEGKTVYVYATKVYTHTATKHWTSGSPVYINDPGLTGDITSSITSVKAVYSGGTIYATSGNQIQIPANNTTSTREFEFSASWSGYSTAAKEYLNQTGISYAYSDVTVTIEYDEIVAAGTNGAKVYPTVRFSQTYGISPATSGAGTINGQVSDGSTSGTVSGHNFTIVYSGTSGTGTYSSSDGSVIVGSKGTTRSGQTNVATNCKAKVTMDNGKDGTSSAFTVKQEANVPEDFSAITLTKSPTTAIAASGGTVTFTASCTFTWTSGSPGSLSTSDFTFAVQSAGNENKRTYTFSNNVLTLGSLTSNYVASAKTTTVRASNSDAGYEDITITEAKNEYTKSLNIVWDFPGEPIPYGGGSTRADVSSATLTYTYESGTPVPDTVSAYDILSNTSISGTGFSFSYSGGEYGTVTATANSGSARTGTLTTTFNGATYVGYVQQSAYVPPVQYNQAYSISWMTRNMALIYNSMTDTYTFDTGNSIIQESFSPITSGAAGLQYCVLVELLGDGSDLVASMEGATDTVPSTVTTSRYTTLSSSEFSRGISADRLTGYSYVSARVTLVGVASNLTMVGNSISMRLII